jgi:hypothetical protein
MAYQWRADPYKNNTMRELDLLSMLKLATPTYPQFYYIGRLVSHFLQATKALREGRDIALLCF